jgi:hypothetical protein
MITPEKSTVYDARICVDSSNNNCRYDVHHVSDDISRQKKTTTIIC